MDWSRVKHFSREEFGYASDVEPDEMLVSMLDQARGLAGVPFELTSGIRSPNRNREVGGVEDSAHTKGLAVDILAEDSRTRFLIVDALLSVGFNRVGVGPDFVHVDIDESKPRDVCWLYG